MATYVVNLQHFLDEDGNMAPGLAGKHGSHYARIVEAATAHPTDEVFLSVVPCRFRPARKPCPGTMIVCRREDRRIVWQCSACDYDGILSGWENSPWDLSGSPMEDCGEAIGLTLTPIEYAVLAGILTSSTETYALIAGAMCSQEGVVLLGPAEVFTLLEEEVAAEANHERSLKRQTVLNAISDKIRTVER